MFSRSIGQLSPWTDEGMFTNITGNGFRDGSYGSDQDNTMTAIAKALLARRLPEGESFLIRINTLPLGYSGDKLIEALNSFASNAAEYAISDFNEMKNTLCIVQCREMTAEMTDGIIKDIETIVIPKFPAWTIHSKAEAFLGKEMKARVIFNNENKSAFVITDRLTMAHWHLLVSMFPAYVPALFNDEPLTADEKAALKSAALSGSNAFSNAIKKLESAYDIKGMRLKLMIGGFERRQREAQLRTVLDELNRLDGRMRDAMQAYAALCKQRDDTNIRYNGLRYITNDCAEQEDSLLTFFQSNKSLDVVSTRESQVTFIVRTYYENFDRDQYESYRMNDTWFSEFMPRNGEFSSADNCRKIMDAMFIDKTIRLRMCGVYTLNITGEASSISGYDYPDECSDYIPNPHLQRHACLGDYYQMIVEALRNADTVGAIQSCIESAKSVNIGESGLTFNPMMREVFQTDKKCFELPDGTYASPAEALAWLNKPEGGTENETNPVNE